MFSCLYSSSEPHNYTTFPLLIHSPQFLLTVFHHFLSPQTFITSSLLLTLGWWLCFLLPWESIRKGHPHFLTNQFTSPLNLYCRLCFPSRGTNPAKATASTHVADPPSSFFLFKNWLLPLLFSFQLHHDPLYLVIRHPKLQKIKFSLNPSFFSTYLFWQPWKCRCAYRCPTKENALDWGPSCWDLESVLPLFWGSASCRLLPAVTKFGRVTVTDPFSVDTGLSCLPTPAQELMAL